jgi:hypothetical protein
MPITKNNIQQGIKKMLIFICSLRKRNKFQPPIINPLTRSMEALSVKWIISFAKNIKGVGAIAINKIIIEPIMGSSYIVSNVVFSVLSDIIIFFSSLLFVNPC